jgi:hypothetical protein
MRLLDESLAGLLLIGLTPAEDRESVDLAIVADG